MCKAGLNGSAFLVFRKGLGYAPLTFSGKVYVEII